MNASPSPALTGFLVIENYLTPARGVRTERKDWLNHEQNSKVNEVPSVVGRVSRTLLQRATVVIDLSTKRLVKNRYGADMGATPEQIVSHFITKYVTGA